MFSIAAVIILDNNGRRMFSKYYEDADADLASVEVQQGFEKNLFKVASTSKSGSGNRDSEIALVERRTVVYRSHVDVHMFVVGGIHENNELLIAQALHVLYRTLENFLQPHGGVERRNLLNNFDKVLMIVDAIVDRGVIIESTMNGVLGQVPLGREDGVETGLAQVLQIARDQFMNYN